MPTLFFEIHGWLGPVFIFGVLHPFVVEWDCFVCHKRFDSSVCIHPETQVFTCHAHTAICIPLYTSDGSKHSVAAYICIFITTSCISTISIYVQSPDFTMSSLFIVYEHNRKEQVELAGSGGYLRPRLLTKKARETRSSLLRKALRRSTMHAGSSHRPSFLPFM